MNQEELEAKAHEIAARLFPDAAGMPESRRLIQNELRQAFVSGYMYRQFEPRQTSVSGEQVMNWVDALGGEAVPCTSEAPDPEGNAIK